MSTELATTKSLLPALTKEELALGTGQGKVGLDDLVFPRVQISAPKSKYTTPGKDAYIEGLQLGQIFNTLSEQQYGKEIHFVPIKYAGRNRTLFTKGLGVECRSTNGYTGGHLSPDSCEKCQYSQWGSAEKGSGSACTLFENFLINIVNPKGRAELVMVSFKKKAIDAFKRLRTFIEARIVPGTENNEEGGTTQPMYRGLYRLGIGQAMGEAGEYDLWSVKNAGEVSPKDYERVKADYLKFEEASFQKGEMDD